MTETTDIVARLNAMVPCQADDWRIAREAADEIERLRHDLDLARIFMRNIRDNAKDSDALSPDQARWKLKVIHDMLEGWA